MKGVRRNTADQRKAKEETRWRLKEYDSVSIENDERKPGKRSKKNYNYQGLKRKKPRHHAGTISKFFKCFSSFALYVVMILFLKISFVLRLQN